MNAPGHVPAAEEDNHALPGPGRLLRAARESAGVSLRDISAQLHLDERTVDSLERDDFDNLPAPTFVRGYLRGFARLLSVPVGPVLEAYDREGFRPPDLVADISEEPENTASDFPVSLVTWAVVLILLAMVVVWWNNNNPELGDLLGPVAGDTEPTNDGAFKSSEEVAGGPAISAGQPSLGTAERTQESTGTPASDPSLLSAQTPASDTAAFEPLAGEMKAETPVNATSRAEEVLAQAEQVLTQSRQAIEASTGLSAGNASTQVGLQGATSAADSADAASGQAPTVGVDSASRAVSSAATGGNADASSTARAASGPGKVHLVVKFTAEAWVQIVDRDEKKLFYNLAKAGQTIDLRGQGPLRVILGRTRGVEVLVDGQRFDVTQHVTKGVARFSLP
jgi:cytoskeleton protein RodZ